MREYYDLLRSTSRTFAVGIEALPRELRDPVTLAYLVLRVSDYFEDSPVLSEAHKRECLERWAALLESPGGPSGLEAADALSRSAADEDRDLPDHRAAVEAGRILVGLGRLPEPARRAIVRHTADTTRGMSQWIARGDDFPDEEALDAYMFEVAGRVGILLTDLFLAYMPRLRKREAALREVAVNFGLGLQTVNVIRGLHEDPGRGWTYVPRSLLPPGFSSGPTRVPDLRRLPADTQERILAFLVRKASLHIADAFRYCQLLPRSARGVRIFCIVPALIASRTAEVSRRDLEVFRAPVKVDRGEIGRLVLRTRFLYFSNRWLESERERVLTIAD